MRMSLLFLIALPVVAESKAELRKRALAAELRAAVAEERLASIPHEQASERTRAAFRASCVAEKIPMDQCVPDMATFTVKRKPEPPKPAEQPAKP